MSDGDVDKIMSLKMDPVNMWQKYFGKMLYLLTCLELL